MTDRVTLPWDFTETLCYSGNDYKWDTEKDDPARLAFEAEFEVLGNKFLSDPNQSWYQIVHFVAVISRKSDGKKFGYFYVEDISKHGQAYIEPNGDDYGLGDEYAVWFEVEPFNYGGYDKKEEA